jgi:NOL1/NOP2/fmu family ribosome biogenesis protein
MQSLKFLNSKEKKEIMNSIISLYGFSGKLDGSLLVNSKEKLYLLAGSEFLQDGKDQGLRIDRAGLYIGTITPSGIRLSVEGSQMVGPHATKNVLTINQAHLDPWVKGQDFLLEEDELAQTGGKNGLYILKLGDDYLGCTIVKDNKVWNCLSKNRRVKNLNI